LAAAENIQIHGGLGMTWEHSAHRYFRRATVCASMLGDGNFHRRRIADWLFAHVAADDQAAEE
jgi:alkylation response protein AidB-like acyl-CoA dehydrogenase